MVPARSPASQETRAIAASGSEVARERTSTTLLSMSFVSASQWTHAGWLATLRPGFMSVTMAAALLVTASSGYLAERNANPVLVADTLDQRAEAMVRRDLARLGWEPLGNPRVAPFVAELEQNQGIEVWQTARPFRLALYHGPVTGEPASRANQEAATRVVATELSRYPRQTLNRARFRRVLLCQSLAEGRVAIPSLPNYQQTLLLDAATSPKFLRRLIHHELFHFIDYADDDQVEHDPEWSRLNGRFFVYGSGGRLMREPDSSKLTEDRRGFLSAYSTSALEEDKAEIFSFLMTHPAAVRRLAESDAVIAQKVAAVRRQASAELPELSTRFWSEVENGKR